MRKTLQVVLAGMCAAAFLKSLGALVRAACVAWFFLAGAAIPQGGRLAALASLRSLLASLLLACLAWGLLWAAENLGSAGARRNRARAWALCLSFAGLAWQAIGVSFGDTHAANGLGLVADTPGPHRSRQGDPGKAREYPKFQYKANSLGYRDEPPPQDDGTPQCWTIGDSFVWGDGIARFDELLHRRIAAWLKQGFGWTVRTATMSCPGLSLYGYRRAVERLVETYQPRLIVIGFLGDSDLNPIDPQRVIDRLGPHPGLFWLFRLVGAADYIHQRSVADFRPDPAAMTAAAQDLEGIRRAAAKTGARVILIDFFGYLDENGPKAGLKVPAEFRVLSLQPEERLNDRLHPSPDYWYQHQPHPKAKLLDRIARRAAALAAAGPGHGL